MTQLVLYGQGLSYLRRSSGHQTSTSVSSLLQTALRDNPKLLQLSSNIVHLRKQIPPQVREKCIPFFKFTVGDELREATANTVLSHRY